MLKFKLETLEGLEETAKAYYVEQADGTFLLSIDGAPSGDINNDGLKKKSQELLDELKQERAKRKQLEDADGVREIEALKAKGDWEELSRLSNEKHNGEINALQERVDTLLNNNKNSLLKSSVMEMAVELAGERASLIEPHLQNRLEVTEKDGMFFISFKDANGNVSPTMTKALLIEEFKNNALFAPIVSGRNSSGGGASGGAGGTGGTDWDKYFDQKSPDYSFDKTVELSVINPTLAEQLYNKYPYS